MPPRAIKTVGDMIYWQYAKIIADSAGFGKRHWRFVMSRFKKFRQGEIFRNEIRECCVGVPCLQLFEGGEEVVRIRCS